MGVTKAYFLLLYVTTVGARSPNEVFRHVVLAHIDLCSSSRDYVEHCNVTIYVKTLQKKLNGERKESERTSRDIRGDMQYSIVSNTFLTLRTNIRLLSNFYQNIIYVSIKLQSATIRLKENDAINLVMTVITLLA